MVAPTLSTFPPAPVRGEDRATFTSKANALVAHYAVFVTEMNDTIIPWMETTLTDAETAATNAATSETNAATSEANAAAQVVLATNQANASAASAAQSEAFKDSAETAAAAAGAAAGLPSLVGNAGKVLSVNDTEDGVFWGSTAGTTLTKTFASSEEYIIITGEETTYAPVISATKEVAQEGVTNNEWVSSISDTEFDSNAAMIIENGIFTVDTGFYYTNSFYDFSAQVTSPSGVSFNADGTKLFIVDSTTDAIYQYALTTAYNLSTVSYTGVSLSVVAQDASPVGLVFNADGTKMFIGGLGNDNVYEYTLSAGFDLGTASYSGNSVSVSAQEGAMQGLDFNPDGTRMYIVGSSTDTVYQYNLSTGYDITTATYSGNSLDISTEDIGPTDVRINPTGTKLYMLGGNPDGIHQYTMSTPFDLSTATYDSVFRSVTNEDTSPFSICFNSDGTNMFMCGATSDNIYEYKLTTAYAINAVNIGTVAVATSNAGGQIDTDYWTDVNSMTASDDDDTQLISYAISDDGRTTYYILEAASGRRNVVRDNGGTWEYNNTTAYGSETWAAATSNTIISAFQDALGVTVGYDIAGASYDSLSFGVSAQDTLPYSIQFNDDGTKMYVVGGTNASVFQYTLSTAYVINTASYDSVSFSVNAQDGTPLNIRLNDDGTKFYVIGAGNDRIYQYSMSTPYDLSTASYDSVLFDPTGQDTAPFGMAFNNDGTKMYVLGNTTDSVYQYTLSTGFDLSTAAYDSVSFTPAEGETTPFGLNFNDDGTKMYIVGTTDDSVDQYTLSTGFDLSTASYSGSTFSFSAQEASPTDIIFNGDGSKMYMVGTNSDTVHQYSIALIYANQMDSTQLGAVGDGDFEEVTTTLDLAVVLKTDDDTKQPTSSGITINYDGNVADQVAINGTDYTAIKIDSDKVKFTATTAGNYRVRIL